MTASRAVRSEGGASSDSRKMSMCAGIGTSRAAWYYIYIYIFNITKLFSKMESWISLPSLNDCSFNDSNTWREGGERERGREGEREIGRERERGRGSESVYNTHTHTHTHSVYIERERGSERERRRVRGERERYREREGGRQGVRERASLTSSFSFL